MSRTTNGGSGQQTSDEAPMRSAYSREIVSSWCRSFRCCCQRSFIELRHLRKRHHQPRLQTGAVQDPPVSPTLQSTHSCTFPTLPVARNTLVPLPGKTFRGRRERTGSCLGPWMWVWRWPWRRKAVLVRVWVGVRCGCRRRLLPHSGSEM